MRLERQYTRRTAELARSFTRHRNHRLVAAMHAIEIAHGEDGAAQRAIGRGIAHDEEAFRRHLTSRVGETGTIVPPAARCSSQAAQERRAERLPTRESERWD